MGIKPFAEVAQESKEEVFESAVNETLQEEEQESPQIVEEGSVDDDAEIEVVVGEPPKEEPKEEVKPTVSAETPILEKLVDLLSERPKVETEKPKRAPIPVVNKEEVKKEFNSKLFDTDDPFALVEKSAEALVGSALAKQSLEIQKLKKEVLKNDPVNKIVFDKWEDEIERTISSLPPEQQVHPDAYDYAIRQVKDAHFDEILEAKIEEKLAAKSKPGKTMVMGETHITQPKAQSKKKIVYATSRDKAEARRFGISLEDYLRAKGRI